MSTDYGTLLSLSGADIKSGTETYGPVKSGDVALLRVLVHVVYKDGGSKPVVVTLYDCDADGSNPRPVVVLYQDPPQSLAHLEVAVGAGPNFTFDLLGVTENLGASPYWCVGAHGDGGTGVDGDSISITGSARQ